MFILIETAFIIFTWVLMFATCVSIGILFQQCFLGKHQHNFLDAFWLGWGSVVFILLLWNFFLPVNLMALLFISAIGMFSLFLNSSKIINHARTRSLQILVILLLVIWMANQSARGDLPYDAGLYHLQLIKWISTCQIIPGLGNLHGRFAFNSTYFLYLALIKSFCANFYKIGSGLLLVVAIAQSFISGADLLRGIKQKKFYFHDIVAFTFLGPLLSQAFRYASTTSPDLPVFIIGFIISVKLSEIFFEDSDSSYLSHNILFIIFISIVGITIKFSLAVFALTSIALAVGRFWMRGRGRLLLNKLLFCCLCGGIVIIFLLRGFILSGYPVYPSTFGGIKTAWQIPKEKAINESDWVKSWARLPFKEPVEVLGSWQWLDPWSKRMLRGANIIDFVLPAIFIIINCILLMLFYKRIKTAEICKLNFLMLPACLSILSWFIFSPDPRFAGSAFFIVGISMVSFLAYVLSFESQKKLIILMSLCGLLYALTVIVGRNPSFATKRGRVNFMPASAIVQQITNSGLIIFTTKKENDQCWDAPLPCTPYFNENLNLRDKNNICKGFYVK
ncbi:MAG TPA: hypothetical protein PL155_09090 [Candidatus Omnitrophota bacterium]|nr:hypothetical protein [Candidatus Omnitrophota bacterium]HPD85389.1 hypothetical protein [Candidatus Omnitrophota bacterium]HRZ04110.1 hypothetical protein [Candidatus Omnitrophota bacterium]